MSRRLLALVALSGVLSVCSGAAFGIPPATASAATRTGAASSTPTPTPITPTPTPTATASIVAATATPSATGAVPTGAQIVATARQYVGYPYAYIGDDPNTGFSCIGFAHFVFAQNGVYVPEDLGQAYDSAPHVDQSGLQPGDLVFFQNTVWSGISHVDLYVGDGKMIGADTIQTGVQYDTLSDQYWQDHYLGATRPLSNPSGTPLVTPSPSPFLSPSPSPQPSDQGSPASTPTPTPTTSTPSPMTSVTPEPNLSIKAGTPLSPRHSATIYSGPGTSYMTLDTVDKGMSLTTVQTQGQWVNVSYDSGNQYGWISGSDLDLSHLSSAGGDKKSSTQGRKSTHARKDVKGFSATHPSTTSGKQTLVVTATILFVRAAPDHHARILRRVRAGDHVRLLSRHDGWDYIQQRDGSRGWVDSHWVRGIK